MKQSLLVIFAILISIAMFGCGTTGGSGDGVHWSTSLSGGVYDSRDGDLGYVLLGSVTLYDRYPANTTMPIIAQTKVKVTNVVSQDQNQSQQGNGNSGGSGSGNGGSDDGDCKGKGHGKHHHHVHGNGHDCDPD